MTVWYCPTCGWEYRDPHRGGCGGASVWGQEAELEEAVMSEKAYYSVLGGDGETVVRARARRVAGMWLWSVSSGGEWRVGLSRSLDYVERVVEELNPFGEAS